MSDDARAAPASGCPHLHHLLDAEQRLREAISLAREQLLHAECVLEQLAGARHGPPLQRQPRDPSSVLRVITSTVRDYDAGDMVGGAPAVVVSTAALTARELEVLQWIATGLSNRKIADRLFLSPRTIERHIANIYLKLDLHTKAEATAWALKHGLSGGDVVFNGSESASDDRRRPENYVCRLHTSTDA